MALQKIRSISDFKNLLWQIFQPQLCYPYYGIYLLDFNAGFLSRANSDKCKYILLWFLPTTLQEVAWAEKEHLGQNPQEASVAGRGLEPVLGPTPSPLGHSDSPTGIKY